METQLYIPHGKKKKRTKKFYPAFSSLIDNIELFCNYVNVMRTKILSRRGKRQI